MSVSKLRKAMPFAAAILLALIVVLASNAGLPSEATYALAGFFGGVLAVGGTLVAVGIRSGEFVNRVSGDEAIMAADLASNPVGDIAATNVHLVLMVSPFDGLEQNVLAPHRPTIAPAGPALRTHACPI
jgi:hypothetical protein